jgi:prepilin-type N-terminal cleavage/methylation domain-containing protein
MKKIKNHTIQKGFTLVELLVVIGVLGVLAAAVLTAIDPLEQMARGRDAGRKSTVSQLGNAAQAYYTSRDATFPTANATWITTLVNNGDIKTAPAGVAGNNCTTNAQPATNGWCYNVAGGEAVIFVRAESDAEITKAACTGTNVPFIAWTSVAGKTGLTCAAAAGPAPTATIN